MGDVDDSSYKPQTGKQLGDDSTEVVRGSAGSNSLFNRIFDKTDLSAPVQLALLESKLEGEELRAEVAAGFWPGAVVDLDDEATRLFASVPAVHQARIMDNYKKMRRDQMEHRPCSLNANDRIELAGWMLFPQTDKECDEGRGLVGKLLANIVARHGRPLDPNNEAKQFEAENHLKAQIASLLKNDHDYLHNDEEIHRSNTNIRGAGDPEKEELPPDAHHLPEKFKAFAQELNPRKAYEEYMFNIFQGKYMAAPDPQNRAAIALCNEVLDQVLQARLLDDNNLVATADRERILNEWSGLFARYDPIISAETTGEGKWMAYQAASRAKFPKLVQAMFPTQLNSMNQLWDTRLLPDADLLREDIERAEAVYQKVQEQAILHVMRGIQPVIGERKQSELRLPDLAHMMAYEEFHNPTMPYKEARRQVEREIILASKDTLAKKYIKTDKLEERSLKNWRDYGKLCSQLKYASADLPEKSAQANALRQDPFWYCDPGNDARDSSVRKSLDAQNYYREQSADPALKQYRRDLLNPNSAVWTDCFHKKLPNGEPFKDYNAKRDPLFEQEIKLLPHPK